MLKKLLSALFSTRLTSILFVVFAAAMATGTFMDASADTSPTPYSRELIYNSWWFEAIMGLFMINFIGNISKYRLLRKEKWATLTLHLSFILIILGAFVTRYISFEGMMHIREGATENTMLSSETYLKMFIDGDYKINGVPQRRTVAPKHLRLSERLNNDFEVNTDYNGQEVSIKCINFIKNAKEGILKKEGGKKYLKIVEAGGGERHDHWIGDGDVLNIHNVIISLNNPTEGAINLSYKNGEYTITSPFEGQWMRMADQEKGMLVSDSLQPLNLRSLYQVAGMAFVIPEQIIEGEYGVIKAPKDKPTNMSALVLEVSSKGETKKIDVLGGQGVTRAPVLAEVGGLKVYVSYGSKEYVLPFSITLNDFIADKYPGTEKNYSAFKSKVTVNKSETEFYDYEIYMNHILDEQGYRFFQSSFDPDEKGTILSVNHDFWGTWITYIGYGLLYLGLLAILFDKNTRFSDLRKMLNKVKEKKAALTVILVFMISFSGIAQETNSHRTKISKEKLDSIIVANAASKEHAAKFAHLVLQDNGRMKPVNTFASELLRKISRKNTYAGLDANQVFISMIEFPQLWLDAPIMALSWKNDSIKKVIGVEKTASYFALMDLIDKKGRNKLGPYIEEASKTINKNQFQKDFMKVYENFYLLNEALSGGIFKIFPIPNDPNNRWVSYPELEGIDFKKDSSVVKNILPYYFEKLKEARTTGDYSQADLMIKGIQKLQSDYGAAVLPSESKINTEILYNKIDIFNRLYRYFAMFGMLMFVFIILQIFNASKTINFIVKLFKISIWVMFISLTAGLISRWYISGHAPWSNAYESIVYVGWATVLFGLTLGRKSALTIASTAFVAAIILWVAHENWIDPSISTLSPVLDSYWLMIHVAVIVASYGPFTLGMILGLTSLLLMVLTTKKNFNKMNLNIKELTIITEMALTVGLVMLSIGNFLGGQWANESWGRYWGWDPKETWALISIMIYAFVVHMRLVPGLRGKWGFNFAAVVAYASIMMTYFGVNFYLVGLHSYASGNIPATPTFVKVFVVFVIFLSIAAFYKYRKHFIKKG